MQEKLIAKSGILLTSATPLLCQVAEEIAWHAGDAEFKGDEQFHLENGASMLPSKLVSVCYSSMTRRECVLMKKMEVYMSFIVAHALYLTFRSVRV